MVLIDVVDPAQRQQRRTDLRTIPLKTQCNNHPTPLQQNGSEPYVLLHGMQGVSRSNPYGSIQSDSLRRKGAFVAKGVAGRPGRAEKRKINHPEWVRI